ncbi:MAG: C40 family peptidase [Prevotellaceae bacterium]|nr:C40 family peptidase [Prevotellaceae bacterium]
MVATAQQLLAAPYLWGGRTALGIDCSGLTQLACGMAGVALPRNAAQQAEQGEAVGAVEHAQPADLAFFANGEGRVVHVGIMLGQGEIIHASGSVRVDSVDQEGIRNRQLGSYTHRLKVVKRVLPRLAGGGG